MKNEKPTKKNKVKQDKKFKSQNKKKLTVTKK